MRVRVLIGGLLAAACSAHLQPSVPDASPSGDGSASQDPGVTHYVGRLAATATVPFGGAPYCDYTVTMKNIVIDLTVHPTKGLTTIVVNNDMVEALATTCSQMPIGTKPQEFDFADSAALPNAQGVYAPMLAQVPTGSPMTALTVNIAPAPPSGLAGTLAWLRTDQTGSLAWNVMTGSPISLDLQPCNAGVVYCFGGTKVGSLWGCEDGIHLYRIKSCPTGCGSCM